MNPNLADAGAVTVGLDLGGTGIRAIARRNGETIASADALSSELGAGPIPERIDRLAEFATNLLPPGTQPTAVGIGASGPVDNDAGIVHNQDTLPWFSDFPLVDSLQQRLGVPVVIDNDAVSAALGEHAAGAGRHCDRMLMITLGTGIGAAMLVDGRPVRGLGGAHPEGGHLPVTADPTPCYCGLTGCWEQAASRSALQRVLRARLGEDHPSRETLKRGRQAATSDPAVRRIFTEYGVIVGRGLAALHALYQPRVTVIGGSAASCLPLFLDGLHQSLTRSAPYTVPAEIRPAELGDSAGVVGAAVLAAARTPG